MLKSILHLLGSNLTIKITAIIFSLYIAKNYGAGILGSYVLFISVYGVGLIAAKLGLFYALEKRISEIRKDENQLISTSLLINTLLLCITILVIFFLNGFLERYIGVEHVLYYLISCIVLGNLSNFTTTLIKAKKKIIVYSRVIFIKEVGPKVFSIIFLFMYNEISMVFLAIIISEIFAFTYSLFHVNRFKLVRPSKESFRSLYDLTKYNAVLEIRALTFNWIDVWMIGFFLSRELVGVYQVAWQIASGILIVNKTLTTAYFPYFSEWGANKKLHLIKHYLKENMYLFLLFPIPIFVGSIIYAERILLLFNEEFVVGSYVLMILMICTIYRSVQELYSKVLVAMDYSKLTFIASTYSGIANILLNYSLVQLMGIEGAALSTTLSSIINFYICSYFLNKTLNHKLNYQKLLPNLYASLLMLFVVFLLNNILRINIFIGIGIGIFVWFVVLILNNTYRIELLNAISKSEKRRGEVTNA
ncbi:flippase [Paenibacillus tarimensis]